MGLISKSICPTTKVLVLALLGLQSMTPAMAYESNEYFTLRTPVTEEVLDSMRGGFQFSPNGPVVSFGIERNVFLNDKLVNSTVINVPNLTQLAANIPNLKQLANIPNNSFKLIQIGGGNGLPASGAKMTATEVAGSPGIQAGGGNGLPAGGAKVTDVVTSPGIQGGMGNALPVGPSSLPPFMTVVQNSLDNQKIQSQTVINATVAALSLARSLQLGNALSQASVEAIRH